MVTLLKKHIDGPLLGSTLLIAGGSIGAGMLALPIIAGLVGFFPALLMCIGVWLYMLSTAHLLIEANGWFPSEEVNLITLADRIIGKTGKAITWITFMFLFYCLLVAYIIKGGELIKIFFHYYFHYSVSKYVCSFLLTFSTAALVVYSTKALDLFNRACMSGLLLTFCLLLSLSAHHGNDSNLLYTDWSKIIFLTPFLITSFGFHNIIPSLNTYLKGDVQKLKTAINAGSFITLLVYLVWLFVMLRVIPLEGEQSILNGFKHNLIATEIVAFISGYAEITLVAQGFALFAIITSFLSQGLSVVDFLEDGLHLKRFGSRKKIACMLAFVPPFIFAQFNGSIFFSALALAGGFSAIILYGFLPAFIVYKGRYTFNHHMKIKSFISKPMLLITMLIALAILSLEYLKAMGWVTLTIFN